MPKKVKKIKKVKINNIKKLVSPKTITMQVTDVEITSIVHDFERDVLQMAYILLLADGTPYQRGRITLSGEQEINDFYALLDTGVSGGKTIRESIDDVATQQITTEIGI